MKTLAFLFILLGAFFVSVQGCPTCAKDDLIETAKMKGFLTLVDLIAKAGLTETLKGEGPFTVFAPTEEAFKAVPAFKLEGLLSDPELLKTVLLAHVIRGNVHADHLSNNMSAPTLLKGYNLTFKINANGTVVNMANVKMVDVEASNGVIHVIDKVIIPQEESDDSMESEESSTESSDNIVQVAAKKGFPTLVSFLKKVGLDATLEGKGPFTVFAPSEMAFAELPSSTLHKLSMDPDLLKSVLLSHVANGTVTTKDIRYGMIVNSFSPGYKLNFSVGTNETRVNGAEFLYPDLGASNGIIHAINGVLIPETEGMAEPEPEPEAEPDVEPKPEPKPYSNVEQKPKSEAEPKPEPEAEKEAEPRDYAKS